MKISKENVDIIQESIEAVKQCCAIVDRTLFDKLEHVAYASIASRSFISGFQAAIALLSDSPKNLQDNVLKLAKTIELLCKSGVSDG